MNLKLLMNRRLYFELGYLHFFIWKKFNTIFNFESLKLRKKESICQNIMYFLHLTKYLILLLNMT